jgi:hypothetical protein
VKITHSYHIEATEPEENPYGKSGHYADVAFDDVSGLATLSVGDFDGWTEVRLDETAISELVAALGEAASDARENLTNFRISSAGEPVTARQCGVVRIPRSIQRTRGKASMSTPYDMSFGIEASDFDECSCVLADGHWAYHRDEDGDEWETPGL